jgi:hypothetical protein
VRPIRDENDILVAPPPLLKSDPESRPAAIRRLVGEFDPAARDARNRDLGRAGEELLGLSDQPWVLAIDRTNWDFGKTTINILMISPSYGCGIRILLISPVISST